MQTFEPEDFLVVEIELENPDERAQAVSRQVEQHGKTVQNLEGAARDAAIRRLVAAAAAVEDAIAYAKVQELACKTAGTSKVVFDKAVKQARAKSAEVRQAKAEEEGMKVVSYGGKDPLYFDGKQYFRMEKDGRYGRLCREDAILHLGVHGFNMKREEGQPSAADAALYRLQKENRIAFAGPLCGRKAGLYEENGMRLLCTSGPEIAEGVAGEFPLIKKFYEGLLGKDQDPHFETQVEVMTAWIKLGRLQFKNPDRYLPGQVMALVGPPDCGKSMFQKMVLTPAFGGRVADPGLWLTGQTTFNEGMWGAEHLALGDKALKGEGAARDEFRDALKELVASPDYPFHPKGEQGRTFRPLWRLSLTANDDPESIGHLPSLAGSFADKAFYLKVYSPVESLWDNDDPEGREAFNKQFAAELPAFIHYVDSFVIPERLVKGRFGVKEWHHPAIAGLIEANNQSTYLDEIVEEWLESHRQSTDSGHAKLGYIEGSTSRIYAWLDEGWQVSRRGICRSTVHMGRLLPRLLGEKKWEGRLSRVTVRGGNLWRFNLAEPQE